jgi:hypothetical protein
MANTINGRTPEEIKKKLEPCKNANCSACYNEYSCKIEADALAYIQQLERERDELLQKNQQLERERDAAVEAVGKLADNCDRSIACEYCEFRDYQCIVCEFKWRGVQEVE